MFIHGRLHIKGGYRCALAKCGHKWAHVVFIDDGNTLKVKRIRKDKTRYFQPLPGYGERATLARAFLRDRPRAEVPKAAQSILTEAIAAE